MSNDRTSQQLLPRHFALVFLALAAVWGWLLYDLHYFWGEGSYYNFGWFVPVFAGYFFYVKLKEGCFELAAPASDWQMRAFWVALGIALLLVAGARLFSEADYYWRVPRWLHGFLLLGLSYALLLIFGGRRALRYFVFPVFFLLMAVPWPSKFETYIIQTLTQWVTDLVVILVNLIGYPAEAMGNTIRVGDVQVGVDEACSGIRSLQALTMIALFFGEFFYFGIWRRLTLLGGAVLLSIGFNVGRAVVLTMIKINGTEEKFDFWHEFLGNFNAIICGLLLFLFAELLVQLFGSGRPNRPVVRWRLPNGNGLKAVFAGLVLGFLIPEAAVRGYYHWRDTVIPAHPRLLIQWPEDGSLVRTPMEVPAVTYELLQYEFGEQFHLRWQSGLEATFMHYGYSGEDRTASTSSIGHTPDVCMTGAGARMLEEKPLTTVQLHDLPWKARHFEFIFDHLPLKQQVVQVFYLIWEERPFEMTAEQLQSSLLSWKTRIENLKHGRRSTARHVILVYFHGDHPDSFVRARFAELLDRIVPDEAEAAK